jgi:hypothetical protein
VVKGRITRIINFVRKFPADGDSSKIRLRKEKIETSWDEFQDIKYVIERLTEEPVSEEKYRTKFEDLYYKVMAKCD